LVGATLIDVTGKPPITDSVVVIQEIESSVPDPDQECRSPTVTKTILGTLKAICDEAHRLGMTVTGHVPKEMNARQAVEAGMDQIAHVNYVLTGFFPNRDRNNPPIQINLDGPNVRNGLKFFKDHGTVVDPTGAALELLLHHTSKPVESFEPGMTKVPFELLVQFE
jgi:hypothetical protein